jgi:hypothetical protein
MTQMFYYILGAVTETTTTIKTTSTTKTTTTAVPSTITTVISKLPTTTTTTPPTVSTTKNTKTTGMTITDGTMKPCCNSIVLASSNRDFLNNAPYVSIGYMQWQVGGTYYIINGKIVNDRLEILFMARLSFISKKDIKRKG